MNEVTELSRINDRADRRTRHPDSLPWPKEISDRELCFYARVCGMPKSHQTHAAAYIAKELAQLADIERHVSICMGLIAAKIAEDPLLRGAPMLNAIMHFAAEEYSHSNMFYRFVKMLAGTEFDLSYQTIDRRVDLFRGPQRPAVKLLAIVSSAYPGESVITGFENRMTMLDPIKEFFLSKLLVAHGLDEARHVQFDHFVFDHIVPVLSDEEVADAQSLYRQLMEQNHLMGGLYAALTIEHFGVEFAANNQAAKFQSELTGHLVKATLADRNFKRADATIEGELAEALIDFSGRNQIHGDAK